MECGPGGLQDFATKTAYTNVRITYLVKTSVLTDDHEGYWPLNYRKTFTDIEILSHHKRCHRPLMFLLWIFITKSLTYFASYRKGHEECESLLCWEIIDKNCNSDGKSSPLIVYTRCL